MQNFRTLGIIIEKVGDLFTLPDKYGKIIQCENKYSLDNSQFGNHGLLIPPLRGLRVVSGSVQKQHGNRGREDRS